MQYQCITRIVVLLCAGAWIMPAAAQGGAIYRSVGVDGTVSYSDQPAPGATEVPDLLIAPTSAAQRQAAQAEADARIEQQLDLAAELAQQRRARSEQRENAALVRAELRESKARQRALAAEQQVAERYQDQRYVYPWVPIYNRRSNHRGRYDDHWRPFQPAPPRSPVPGPLAPERLPEPTPLSRPLPKD